MQNIAQIGFKADTKDLGRARTELETLGPAAQRVETAAEKLGKRIGWTADATGRWGSETGKIVGAADRAAAGVDKFDKRTSVLGTTLKSSLVLMGGFAAAAGAMFAGANIVNTLADFEYQMSAVAAVSGATGTVLESLRDTAKELGSTTEFSATQAAEGLKLLSQAGFSAEAAIATIPAVLNLATTEGMALGAATDYVASIMAGFGLSVADAARTTDVLVYASNAANTGVAELGEGMKYLAPIARALGISIEDSAAAMGILSNAGLKGSQAGTMLRGVLAALGNPSKQAADEISRLGLTVEALNPQTNSLQSIVDKLAKSGLSAASAFKIFGTEAAPAILALVANRGELEKLNGEMGNVAGTAQRVADYMRDNLRGSLQNLSSAAEALVIALGEAGLTAVLRAVFDGITAVALSLTSGINAFGQFLSYIDVVTPALAFLGDNMNIVLSALGGLTAAIIAYYTPAIIASVAQMAIWSASLLIARGGFIGLTASVYTAVASLVTLRGALIATGLGAIAVAVGLVINEVLKLSDELGGLGAVWVYIRTIAEESWKRIEAGAQWLVAALTGVWAKVERSFLIMVVNIRTAWAGLLRDISAQAAKIPKSLGGGLVTDFLDDAATNVENAVARSEESIGKLNDTINSASEKGASAFEAMTAPLDFNAAKESAKEYAETLENIGGTGAGGVVPPPLPEIPGLPGDSGGGAGGRAEKLKEEKTALEQLAEQYRAMSEPINQAQSAYDSLDEAKKNGLVTDEAYIANLERIRAEFEKVGGTADQWAKITASQAETVGQKLEDLGTNSINRLDDQLAEFTVKGKANFKDFAMSIIQDLVAIAIQFAIIKPLMASFGFAKGGSFGVPAVEQFAAGGAFTNSVVNRPTPFKFASGGGFGLGVMGEAGPEAVMPLQRGPDGSLGVQMYGSGNGMSRDNSERPIRLIVEAQEGEMFRPTIRAESQDVAIRVVDAKTPGIVKQSRDTTQKAMNKTKVGWGTK